MIDPQVTDFAHLFGVNRSFMQDVLSGEQFDLSRYLARVEPGFGGTALGLRAIRDGHGFRNDGSEQYGDFLIAHWLDPQTERQRHLAWLRDGQEMYVSGSTISASRLAQLEATLQWAQARGITVIGFLPSYMPSLYQQMIADGNHTYITNLDAALQPLFARYNFPYFNFTDGAALGAATTTISTAGTLPNASTCACIPKCSPRSPTCSPHTPTPPSSPPPTQRPPTPSPSLATAPRKNSQRFSTQPA